MARRGPTVGEKIVSMLKNGAVLEVSTMAERLRVQRSSVVSAVLDLERAGKVERVSVGCYRLVRDRREVAGGPLDVGFARPPQPPRVRAPKAITQDRIAKQKADLARIERRMNAPPPK